jgi:HEAT repeat protein
MTGRDEALIAGWIKGLWSATPKTAEEALQRLIQCGQQAMPALAAALEKETRDARQATLIRVLGRIGPDAACAVPLLTAALGSEQAHVRQAAAEALGGIGERALQAVLALVVLLRDWHAAARRDAARALARVGAHAGEVAVLPLVQALADRDEEARQAAQEALARIGRPAVPLLVGLLKSDDPRMEHWLAWQMESLTWHKRAEECLLEGGSVRVEGRPDDPNFAMTRREPIKAMRNISWWFAHSVEDQLRMETAREAAVHALGGMGADAQEAVPVLADLLAGRGRRARQAAGLALGRIGPPARAALPALVRALVDGHEAVRRAAAESLRLIDPGWAAASEAQGEIDHFAQQLALNGEPQDLAGKALALIGAPAVPALVNALQTGDRIQREAAATALGNIGPPALAASAALERAQQDSHNWVREAAAAALKKVRPEGGGTAPP